MDRISIHNPFLGSILNILSKEVSNEKRPDID